MDVVKVVLNRLEFICPACKVAHSVIINHVPGWNWNGSKTEPTITPEIKNAGTINGKDTVCHSVVTDGKIEFLPAGTHELSGQTVKLGKWEEPFYD